MLKSIDLDCQTQMFDAHSLVHTGRDDIEMVTFIELWIQNCEYNSLKLLMKYTLLHSMSIGTRCPG